MKETGRDRSTIYQVNLDPENANDARIIASKYIPTNSIVLDVGSACGDFGFFLHKTKNCEMHGMEFSADSIEIARQTHAYASIHQVDLNCFDGQKFRGLNGRFDVIALLDVLEHVVHFKRVLQELIGFLKDGGVFVISLPNIAFGDVKLQLLTNSFTYTETGILDETHVRFFTFRTIADFLSRQGIQILGCSVVIADFSFKDRLVPAKVRSYILNDPHSFVYQYVLKAKPSNLDVNALSRINLSEMEIGWGQINPRLKAIRRKKWLNAVLPPGSSRREIVKKVLGSVRKSD